MFERIAQIKERVWRSPNACDVPYEVRKALVSQYRLDVDGIDKLRCVSKDGEFAGQRVKHIRLYDPSLSDDGMGKVRKYEDLANHKKAILFEGNIDKEGHVYLADRRHPKKTVKTVIA